MFNIVCRRVECCNKRGEIPSAAAAAIVSLVYIQLPSCSCRRRASGMSCSVLLVGWLLLVQRLGLVLPLCLLPLLRRCILLRVEAPPLLRRRRLIAARLH